MIRFRTYVFENYFIDEKTAVITDINGKILPQYLTGDYLSVYLCKEIGGAKVHQIQAHTKWGYKGPEWHVHHKDENTLNNEIDNLKYVPKEIHASITNKGRVHTEESKNNMSEAHLGQKAWNKGLHTGPLSEECKEKLSKSLKGCVISDEVKIKISNTLKGHKVSEDQKNKLRTMNIGKHWFNNGIKNVLAFTCPDGYVEGRLSLKQ